MVVTQDPVTVSGTHRAGSTVSHSMSSAGESTPQRIVTKGAFEKADGRGLRSLCIGVAATRKQYVDDELPVLWRALQQWQRPHQPAGRPAPDCSWL